MTARSRLPGQPPPSEPPIWNSYPLANTPPRRGTQNPKPPKPPRKPGK